MGRGIRARLDQIINLKYELVQLGAKDRLGLDRSRGRALYSDNGRPAIANRLLIGLLLLKHI